MKKIPLILTALLSSPALSALPPYATWYRPSTNTAYLYLQNPTDQPLTLTKLSINQKEESPTPWPLDPNRQADWFDMTPPTLPPHQVAQIRVHLRHPATTPIELTATTPAGDCTAIIPPVAPTLTFSDITFSPTTISLFTTNATSPITQVLVDGSDQTQNCDLTAATPHQGV
ncbi:MAG TPA: hypothetical protein VFE58_02060, partial [Tepidisphaeraceae bacterium]|nr:hypothetical protein [Tepidisphaeraceae bacterium]